MDELPTLIDAAFEAIGASGLGLAGPPFSVYYGDDEALFDIDMGFPVAEALPAPISGAVPIEPSSLPAGDALALSHFGSYESLADGWNRLAAEATARRITPKCYFEVYATEPVPGMDPADLRTDLFFVI